jgi:glycerol-3-phosphate acyltransferase PlsX
MGADGGAERIIHGGIDAARQAGSKLRVVFVGHEDVIQPILKTIDSLPDNLSVQHAETEVPMHIAATEGARLKDSSIAIGLQMIKRGEVGAFVSPGNTGAVMATALMTLGRIEGVSRPAISAMFPSSAGKPTVVLDAGANADCKSHHLAQFAVMGSVYSAYMLNLEAPRVGLISIGEERSKGNELIFNAQKLLKDSHINFVGNIEGRDILSGAIDVAVTDGFTGNILLKFAESIKPMLARSVQRQVQTNMFSRVGAMLLLPFLRRMRSQFDYAERGGAPLLGVNGNIMICHGSSSSRAMQNAVIEAHRMASRKILERIHDEIVTNHFGRNNGAKNQGQNSRDGIVCAAAGSDQRRS